MERRWPIAAGALALQVGLEDDVSAGPTVHADRPSGIVAIRGHENRGDACLLPPFDPSCVSEEIEALSERSRSSAPSPAGASPFAIDIGESRLAHLYETARVHERLGDATAARRCLLQLHSLSPDYRDVSARIRAISEWPTLVPEADASTGDDPFARHAISA